MKRKLFVTAVVLLVMATPLFAAQAASPAKPAQGAAAKPAEKQSAAPKPSATAPAKGAVPTAAKPSAPVLTAKGAPAAPKVTSVRVNPPPAPKPSAPGVAKAAPAAAKPSTPAVAKAAPAPAPKPAPAVVKAGPVALTSVQEKLQANKDLMREVQAKLAGADVVALAAGFKDLQQFVSAAHASHNLGLSFDALKAKLLAGKRTSLRQAIQELKPASSAAVEAQRAEYDAIGTISATEASTAAAAAAAKPAKAAPAKDAPVKAAPKGKPPVGDQE